MLDIRQEDVPSVNRNTEQCKKLLKTNGKWMPFAYDESSVTYAIKIGSATENTECIM